MVTDYGAVGAHLMSLRKARKLTITEAASRAAILPHILRAIEAGRSPNVFQLIGLARAYGVYLEIGFGALSMEKPRSNAHAKV